MDSYDNQERPLNTPFASLLSFVLVSGIVENETHYDSFFLILLRFFSPLIGPISVDDFLHDSNT